MSAAAPSTFADAYTPAAYAAAVARHKSAPVEETERYKVKKLSCADDSPMEATKKAAYDAYLSDTHDFETGSLRPPRFTSWKTVVAEFERFLLWRTNDNTTLFKTKIQAGTCLMRFNFVGYTPTDAEMSALLARLDDGGDLATVIERIGRLNCDTDCLGASYFSGGQPVVTKKGVVVKKAGLNQIAVILGCVSFPLMEKVKEREAARSAL